MKHFLFASLLIFSTLSAAEDVNLQLKELKESNYATCRDGFFATGAFVGITSLVSLKILYGANTSVSDFRQLVGADSVYASKAKYCQEQCYKIQDSIRDLDLNAWQTLRAEKEERIAWITSGKHFLYGMAFGAAFSAVLKTMYEPEKVQPHDIIIPAALVTLSLVTAKMADDHVNAARLYNARKKAQ